VNTTGSAEFGSCNSSRVPGGTQTAHTGAGSGNGNTYCVNIPQLAAVLRDASVGLDPKQMTVTLTPSQGSATTDTLDKLLNGGTYSTTIWSLSSPQGTNGIGQHLIPEVRQKIPDGHHSMSEREWGQVMRN
jgi:hypothetical protein